MKWLTLVFHDSAPKLKGSNRVILPREEEEVLPTLGFTVVNDFMKGHGTACCHY
jgi:hypothetical protein